MNQETPCTITTAEEVVRSKLHVLHQKFARVYDAAWSLMDQGKAIGFDKIFYQLPLSAPAQENVDSWSRMRAACCAIRAEFMDECTTLEAFLNGIKIENDVETEFLCRRLRRLVIEVRCLVDNLLMDFAWDSDKNRAEEMADLNNCWCALIRTMRKD
jgi:hypothetical protein